MGNIIVTLAKTESEKKQANQLIAIQYGEKLEVDMSKLHSEHFNCDVLLAYTEVERKLVGTMSVMYPNSKGIYPCEALFGVDLKNRKLVQKHYIEIGRFATNQSGEECNKKVVLALFLGAIQHLKKNQIQGWIAIVKDHIFDFLKRRTLPMNIINQKPRLSANHPLFDYAKDTHLFDVLMVDTILSFQRFNSYEEKGLVKVQL